MKKACVIFAIIAAILMTIPAVVATDEQRITSVSVSVVKEREQSQDEKTVVEQSQTFEEALSVTISESKYFVMWNTDQTYAALGEAYFGKIGPFTTHCFNATVWHKEEGKKVEQTNISFHGLFYPRIKRWWGIYDGEFCHGKYTKFGEWTGFNMFEGTHIKPDKGNFVIFPGEPPLEDKV